MPVPVVPPPARVATPPAPKVAGAARPAPLSAAKPASVAAPKPAMAPAAKPAAPAAADPPKVKGKYTLQLSAFPTREEADAFASRFDGTYVLPSELPGRGLWFRVRCGNYATYPEAAAAKIAFEKQNKVVALVSPR